ncbi:MAG: CBS domain-containing protein [Stackebrandtia sp.]
MTTARDIMHPGAQCVPASQSLAEAARMMRDQHVGALPICGDDNRLKGIITDRDIVVKCIAEGRDPYTTTAMELSENGLYWVEAAADGAEVTRMMREHKIRRLPVVDRDSRQLVGMISESDLARHLDDRALTDFVHDICQAPPNN